LFLIFYILHQNKTFVNPKSPITRVFMPLRIFSFYKVSISNKYRCYVKY